MATNVVKQIRKATRHHSRHVGRSIRLFDRLSDLAHVLILPSSFPQRCERQASIRRRWLYLQFNDNLLLFQKLMRGEL